MCIRDSITPDNLNLHDVGVNPRGRRPEPSPTWDKDVDLNQARPKHGLESVETNTRFTREVSKKLQQNQKGGTREAMIYGGIAVMCILSGRLDTTAIVMRVLVMVVCGLVMKALGFIQL
eukprot:TRINITY_DN5269_c0_g1_i1.p1 TRINITY_DN5269_c0_g1~~TRINITY_DN5269_c0_g1_i1.p1  ORF type:complete len:119 (+),score=36.04 TRINITY_DN5269_c0_g1_i1:148-504(+)